MGNKVICIERQFGSGGHELAVKLSEKTNIRVYEEHLIKLASIYGELSEKILLRGDEKATNPYLFETVHEGNEHVKKGEPVSEVLFALQKHEIIDIALKGDAIFVGRCADYILKEAGIKRLSVFVYNDIDSRIERKMKLENLSYGKASRLVKKMDGQRKKYYEHYSSNKWGEKESFDLFIDLSQMSMDEAIKAIVGELDENSNK
ncbi:MAG: AAA family ATPase [Erysipelotrichaceae bacterium]